ncbi:MAG TPA: integrase core domain-containing protein [Verrucomicrobiota bacterium]|nr:integrase core domain-containing protein [Verrucomicrobiota bacterium]
MLGAIDFTTIEVWTRSGLVTFYLLFLMEVSTRRVHLAGCTTNPDERWMKQVARNLTDPDDGFLAGTRYVLMDRDAKFSAAFRSILEGAGVKSVRLPAHSPDLNSHLERFMRSLKGECLERMIFFGESSLRTATVAFLAHYHGERNHQGLDNQLIDGDEEVGRSAGQVQCRERLDGNAALLLPGRRIGPSVVGIMRRGSTNRVCIYALKGPPTLRVGSHVPRFGRESAARATERTILSDFGLRSDILPIRGEGQGARAKRARRDRYRLLA